jgi:phospholipase D
MIDISIFLVFMNFFSKKELFLFSFVIIIVFLLLFFFKSYCVVNVEPIFYKDYSIDVFFCPDDFCSSVIISEINSAQESIFIAIYSFTHDGIADSLISAKARGVDVRIVFDFLQSTSSYSKYSFLEENNINVFIKKDSGVMHNKFAIIDGKKVLTGSFNYSFNADNKNDENIVLINDKDVAIKFLKKFNDLFYYAG